MNTLGAIVLAFLPKRYRLALLHGYDVAPIGAIIGGILEMLVSLYLLVDDYFPFVNHWLAGVPKTVVNDGMMSAGETSLMGLGGVAWMLYLLQPFTLVFIYFFLEGGLRALAGIMSGEVTPSLPFQLIALAEEKWKAWREESAMGLRVPDQVEPGASDGIALRIASCRPKDDWNDKVTISYQQVLYEVAGEETGIKPRPFIYFLRLRPEYNVIRALRYYHPDEVLGSGK